MCLIGTRGLVVGHAGAIFTVLVLHSPGGETRGWVPNKTRALDRVSGCVICSAWESREVAANTKRGPPAPHFEVLEL